MTNNLQSITIKTEQMFDKTTDEINYICGDGAMLVNSENENCNYKGLIQCDMEYYKKINEFKEKSKAKLKRELASNG